MLATLAKRIIIAAYCRHLISARTTSRLFRLLPLRGA
jgi:hypothetical protein